MAWLAIFETRVAAERDLLNAAMPSKCDNPFPSFPETKKAALKGEA